MELLDELFYVQKLAVQKAQYEQQEKQFWQEIKAPAGLNKIQEIEEVSLGNRGLAVFAGADIVLGIVINKVGSYILTLQANGGMTQEESIAAGNIIYHTVDLFLPVGIVVAVPLALLLIWIAGKAVKVMGKKKNREILQLNQRYAEENVRIMEQNEAIEKKNEQINRQLEEIKAQKGQLLHVLRKNVPWYPEAYFSIEAVSFVITQLQEGRASSFQQALVQYEAAGGLN